MKKNLVFSAVILSAVLCSCNGILDEGMETDYEAAPQEICINAFVGLQTKAAVTGTTFPTTRNFHLSSYFNAVSGGTSKEYFEDIAFGYQSSVWKASPSKYWPLTGTLDFLAVSSGQSAYPTLAWNSTNATTDVTVTLADNSTVQDDILVACATGKTYSSSGVALAFQHVESLVAFTVTGTTAVEVNSITLDSHKTSGTCKIVRSGTVLTPTWTPGTDTGTKAFTVSEGQALTASASAFGSSYLVIPQAAVGFTINYTCDGLTVSYHVDAPVATWAAGKKYTYAINLTLDEITVSASVTDWTGESTTVTI